MNVPSHRENPVVEAGTCVTYMRFSSCLHAFLSLMCFSCFYTPKIANKSVNFVKLILIGKITGVKHTFYTPRTDNHFCVFTRHMRYLKKEMRTNMCPVHNVKYFHGEQWDTYWGIYDAYFDAEYMFITHQNTH